MIPSVRMPLGRPPEVINSGRSTHGVRRPVDEFELPQLWSVHLYGYHADLEVDGRSYPITPGTVSLVPPATRHRFHYRGPSTHLFAHLRATDVRGEPAHRLALIMSPGAGLPMIADLMESAIAAAAVRPERTRANLWGVLLRLVDPPAPPYEQRPAQQHLHRAMSEIESGLAEPLTVGDVATAAGISANHLTRIFRAEVGQTVVGYIRRRRIDRARRLLTSSTMSIGAIAAGVGFADLQSFNKACRAVTGRSPRQLRADGDR